MSKAEEAVHNLMHSYEVTTIDAAKKRWKDNDNVLHSRLCRHMVEWIADPENEVTGEADDYYRLMGAAFESSDYLSAVRIAEIGLAKYPYNVDLLAFAVRVSGKAGDFDKAEAFLQQMQKIDRKYWNWSTYTYAVDMLRAEMSQVAGSERDQLVERILQLCDTFIADFPMEDRAYNLKAEVLISVNRMDDAKQVLQNAIFNTESANGKLILAPQCCVTYLEELLKSSNDYDLIIKVATKGLIATATDEDSAKFGYFVYRIALAKDAQVVASGFDNRDKVKEALAWYQNAFDSATPNRRKKSAQRYLFIRQNSRNPIDQPLIDHEYAQPDPERLQRDLMTAAKKIQEETEE